MTPLRSWLESANDPAGDFGIHNLPYGVFDAGRGARIGVAIGDGILDLHSCVDQGLFDVLEPETRRACCQASLNSLMSVGTKQWSRLRRWLTEILGADSTDAVNHERRVSPHLIPAKDAAMMVPVEVGDYTDFFASLYHATNAGKILRPDTPVWPNYKYIPIGYHSRASSVVISGTPIHRPKGQIKPPGADRPHYCPCALLDYELEVGFFTGPGNGLGEPISINAAPRNIFGACLLNDWSARDIQFWESQPLGPFLSKSFSTTVSPWVIPMAALEPFRVPAFPRPSGDPAPLPHLSDPGDQQHGGIDLTLEVHLLTARMRAEHVEPTRLTRGNFRDMYWTIAQMVAHHTSNGCNLRPGDLLGSGTVSGATPDSLGCLLELTRAGADAIQLPNGEMRRFLEDGDEVILRGFCERGDPGREDYLRIGLGECSGVVVPA